MLRFLFYANFDNKVGPQMPICVPHAFMMREEFNEISTYIIPPPSLSYRVITINWKSNLILNFPIRIEDSKYERHAFHFSFGMVLRKPNSDEDDIEIECYERALRRLTLIFLSMENDLQYLSEHDKYSHYPPHFEFLKEKMDPNNQKQVPQNNYVLRDVLMKMFEQFKKNGECTVSLAESRKIALKLSSKLPEPPKVRLFQVPVLICDLSDCIDHRWDISLQYVLKQINSINHVERICDILKSKLMDVDNKAVTECVKQLLYYKVIKMVDIFQFKNIYRTTPHVHDLMHNSHLQESCYQFVIKAHYRNDFLNNKNEFLSENEICNNITPFGSFNMDDQAYSEMACEFYKLYTYFNSALTVKQFIVKYKCKSHHLRTKIDIHKFVLFGCVNNLIQRVHEYPVIIKDDVKNDDNDNDGKLEPQPIFDNRAVSVDTTMIKLEKHVQKKATFSNSPLLSDFTSDVQGKQRLTEKMNFYQLQKKDNLEKLKRLCDGSHCLDQICCELKQSAKYVYEVLFDIKHIILHR